MFNGNDLIGWLLVGLVLCFTLRAARPAPTLGRASPAPPCDVVVELDGQGARCLTAAVAARERLGSGTRLAAGPGRPRVLGRMAPARLAAWAVPVDVNRADVAELASLDGVGPKLAARLVAERPYRSVDDVGRVRGLGRRRFARLRPRLTVDGR